MAVVWAESQSRTVLLRAAGDMATPGTPGSAAAPSSGKLWSNVFNQDYVQYQATVQGHQFVSPHDTGVLAEGERPALVEQVNQSRLLMGAGMVRTRGCGVWLCSVEAALALEPDTWLTGLLHRWILTPCAPSSRSWR